VDELILPEAHRNCSIWRTLAEEACIEGNLANLSAAECEAYFAKAPSKKVSEYKRDVVERGMDSKPSIESIEVHERLLDWTPEFAARWKYLTGDTLTQADIASISYVIRLDFVGLKNMWAARSGVAAWYERMRAHPCVENALFNRLGAADWAPFKKWGFDAWPQVERIIASP